MIQIRVPLANYVYGCHMTPVTHGACGYVSYQKGIIQGHLVHRYASRRAPALCSRIVFRTVLSLDGSTQTVFLCNMSVKYTLRRYLWCFLVSMLRTGCYVKQMKSIWLFNPSSVIYMRAQVSSNTIAYICWLIQTVKYQCCGFKVHFKSIWVYNLKTKSHSWSKCPHCIMGYMINLSSIFFLYSLVLNLAYSNHSLCQIWSVYMQHSWCCDHSNECLFIVIQQAEVLLNFFWWV